MATTTIPSFVKALISSLGQRDYYVDQKVSVINGPPPSSKMQNNTRVWFGDVKGAQKFVSIAAGVYPKEETYTVDLVIDIQKVTGDMDALVDQAFLILAEVENELRFNPDQGITGILWSGLNGPVEHFKMRGANTCQVVIYAGVYVKARI